MPELSRVGSGGEQIDPRELRRALGRFVTGVAVATTQWGGRPVGLTINSFSSVSLDPPLVLWSLRTDATSLNAFLESGRYAINVLSAAQHDLAARFATRAPDRFAGLPWEEGIGACPLLPSCLAYFECRLEEAIERGDHLVLLGSVERASHRTGPPLLFTSGTYGVATALNPDVAPLEL